MQRTPPYRGLRRRLVLAIDLGTTFSGVSYSILDPGQVPEIRGVTRFPAHEQISGASKIPTIMYYDQDGRVRAFGAEAVSEDVQERALDGDWVKAEWFKLHIRPRDEASYKISSMIPPLPLGKSAIDLAADFLRYLFQCTEEYIKDTHANGAELWESVEEDIDLVLSHPNGWEGYQQSQLRKAVVQAGLIPDNKAGHARVSFVTEGEASLHFAIQNGLPTGVMDSGDGVVIVDAGGGTIDISTYRKPKYSKTFEEIFAPQCHFCGSIFVSINAKLFLNERLHNSEYLPDLDHIVRCFDRTTKIRFSDDQQPQYIKFGSTRDNDFECNIRFGQLKLQGSDVARFFKPSVQSIVDSVKKLLPPETSTDSHPISAATEEIHLRTPAVLVVSGSARRGVVLVPPGTGRGNLRLTNYRLKPPHDNTSLFTDVKSQHIVLVGGFGSSDWLFKQLQQEFSSEGVKVMRPELYVNKAVSDGAVSFYLSHMVTARIARYSYGTFRNVQFKPGDPDHERRFGDLLVRPSGRKLVPNSFEVMLSKGTRVSDESEAKVAMWKEADSKDGLSSVSFDVICYKGKMEKPAWQDEDPSNFRKLCRVTVDLSHLPLEPKTREGGGTYYVAKYWVGLLFNSAELKAQMTWYENGIEQKSPASLVFYQDT